MHPGSVRDTHVLTMSHRSTHPTAVLKAGFIPVFEKFYSSEIAEVMAEVHALYHHRFVQELMKQESPGGQELTNQLGSVKLRQVVERKLRRARSEDILPKGPQTDALIDEVVEFVASAGECSISEVMNFSHVLGCDPNVVRTVVARLVKAGRIERSGGKDELDKRARYRCKT